MGTTSAAVDQSALPSESVGHSSTMGTASAVMGQSALPSESVGQSSHSGTRQAERAPEGEPAAKRLRGDDGASQPSQPSEPIWDASSLGSVRSLPSSASAAASTQTRTPELQAIITQFAQLLSSLSTATQALSTGGVPTNSVPSAPPPDAGA